jgi:signal transduction histidine kinase
MKSPGNYIQQRLSLHLGLQILGVVGLVVGALLLYVFYQTRQYAKQEAINHATQVLDSTEFRINTIMDKVEAATTSMEPLILSHLTPDSLLAYSRQMLERNPDVLGFTIAMEPDFFPEQGRLFSAYSLRRGDSITTIIENNYLYHERVWYKTPREQRKGYWPEPYLDEGDGVLTSSEYNYSYCKPLFDSHKRIIGILCTDMLLKEISEAVTKVDVYPNSSAIMLSHDGRYIVHPDTAKLVRETIFSDPDPQAQQNVVRLGEAMLAGQNGMQQMIVDGHDAYIFYRPLERTGWSIAIVCPASDIFHDYYSLLYSVWTIIIISLLVLLVLCYQSIRRSIIPLNQLALQTQRIAEGHFEELLPHSTRRDTVGQLQNSFILMQQSIHRHISEIQKINDEMEQRNQELVRASQLVQEADQQKTAFVQDMSHQIRTPLNIINGFTQVLSADYHSIPDDELNDIITRMRSSAKSLSHITRMLIVSSSTDSERLNREQTTFSCNALCHEAVASVIPLNPDTVSITFETDVPDDYTIHSDREALLSILGELLDNANKFTHHGSIKLECFQPDNQTTAFAVSDTGIGIAEDDSERIFTKFIKINNFTEGIGLGLPLSQQTARMLGGDLTIDTSYKEGSRFVLSIKS